jgi:hypothetical protein
MPALLAWVDHDAEARDRTLRILSLFQERESRDELGLGGIRDSFADQLFPGTSTIQTRLRYMLIIPWVYKELEQERVPPGEFAKRADVAERDLIKPLIESDDRSGVFGLTAGRRVKRLPSSVYWAGLGAWGIRLTPYSQEEYHRRIGDIYRSRTAGQHRATESARRGDDLATPDLPAPTWHPRIPEPPASFPHEVNFALTKDEAGFLLDRILFSHPESLLAHLALRCQPATVATPWHHPDYASFSDTQKGLLRHARLFSEVMHGAALLYNILLAERRSWQERIDEHRLAFDVWQKRLPRDEIAKWDLAQLWALTMDHGHTITGRTRGFVEGWVKMVRVASGPLDEDNQARREVEQREISLKKSRSRFRNQRALDQWGGRSGVGRLLYRWPNVRILLKDLHSGQGTGEQ